MQNIHFQYFITNLCTRKVHICTRKVHKTQKMTEKTQKTHINTFFLTKNLDDIVIIYHYFVNKNTGEVMQITLENIHLLEFFKKGA